VSTRRCERVLVTGGQGFTGRHLVAHWLRADPDVRVIAVGRSPRITTTFTSSVGWGAGSLAAPLPDDLRVDGNERYTYRALDLIDVAAVADVLSTEQVDTVVHLAASLRDSPFDALVRNNVGATRCLLDAVGAAERPIRVVLGSSGSVYGSVPPGSLPVTEETPVQPIDEYSVTKRTAEDLASVRRRAAGLDVVVGRIFNVIGRGEDERHLAPHLARQFAQVAAGITEHVEVGPLDTTRDFVDVEDVAGALVALATEASSSELVNVASGRETPTRELFDVLAAEIGYESGPVATRPARPLDMPRQQVDVSRLVALGHTPSVPLADSLRSMLAYYLDVVRPAAGRPAEVPG
jgi:nucleoside-diphosphate-sugar epimerase